MKKLLLTFAFISLVYSVHAAITIVNSTHKVGKITWARWNTYLTKGPGLAPGQQVTVTPPMPGSFFFNSACEVTITDNARYVITIKGQIEAPDDKSRPDGGPRFVDQYQVNGVNCNWEQLLLIRSKNFNRAA